MINTLRQIEESLDQYLFRGHFASGIYVGAALAFTLVIRFHGLNATLHDGQIHFITLIWLAAMGWFFHERLPIKTGTRRFLYSALMTFWFFEVHDLFWFVGTIWIGVRVGLPTFFPSVHWYYEAFWKYLAVMTVTTYVLRKYLTPSRNFKILFLVQVLCYSANIVYHVLYGDLPFIWFIVRMSYDSAPYFWIIKREAA